MRRACVLRQLGRCANLAPALSPPWAVGSTSATASSGLLRRELGCRAGNALDTYSRPFTTTPTRKAASNTQPPVPPHSDNSAQPPFAALAAPEQFRAVMRLLPHSVVVCTSRGSGGGSGGGATTTPCGMTMSSLTSLSLRPAPLVTFNIATPSRTLDAVSASRRFNVHVLSGDTEGARVADWFRRGNAEGLGVFESGRMMEGCGCEAVVQKEEEQQAPLLKGRGVLYAMRCRLLDDEPHRGLVAVRDHVVVLAEVVEIIEGRSEQDGEEVFGLAYADRRYRQLGGTIVTED